MKKIQLLCIILCLTSNVEATRLYYCFNKNTEEVTVSRSSKDPLYYTSYIHDIDESNHGIVTIHPLMDDYGIGQMENPKVNNGYIGGGKVKEYYPVVRIDDNTFAGCSWITRINIPATIKTIGRNVFAGCKSLQYIHVDPKNPYFASDDGVLYNKQKTLLIKFPAAKDASSFFIPETVQEIAEGAFEGVKMDNKPNKETGNPNFDKETNYQFKNVPALKGETLYLVPLTGANYKDLFGQPIEHYHNFMDYDNFWAEDLALMITAYQYKYDPYSPIDAMVAGTHKRWIENHRFYVDDVKRIEDYEDWVLYLTDLNTGEKVKYVCNGEKKYTRIDMENFPFIVEKHYNYLKSLIGTNLVFATNGYGMFLEESYAPFYNNSYETDIETGNKIKYTTPYVKWTIKDVGYDVYEMALYFIVSNGENTTKVYYDNQYSEHHPTYNIGNRVFPEKQWNRLIKKYGEQHMALIMSTKVSDDMSLEEKYLAGGRKLAKAQKTSDQKKKEKEGESIVKEIKKIGKSILGW